MKPKPPPKEHRRVLCRILQAALARARPAAVRALPADGEWLTLVSWTHRFYGVHRDVGLDLSAVERLLRSPEPTEEAKREIDSRARRLARMWHVVGDALPFLGRLVARPELRLTMSEALRYLHDRGGVATEVRNMLKTPLLDAARAGRPVLLIGHSLGSVIAYDTLWELSQRERSEMKVDLFLTLGSPLGTRFVRAGLCGADRRGDERYPANIRSWANFSARGDLTALHPRLAPFFQDMLDLGLLESFEDHADLYNHYRDELGLNVHHAYGYLIHRLVAGRIGDWLEDHARLAA